MNGWFGGTPISENLHIGLVPLWDLGVINQLSSLRGISSLGLRMYSRADSIDSLAIVLSQLVKPLGPWLFFFCLSECFYTYQQKYHQTLTHWSKHTLHTSKSVWSKVVTSAGKGARALRSNQKMRKRSDTPGFEARPMWRVNHVMDLGLYGNN